MLSRVAESVYWMSLYIERAENVARFIQVNQELFMDHLLSSVPDPWMPLVSTTGDQSIFLDKYGEATEENVIRFLTFDTDNPDSIISCVTRARENARTVRDVISSEMWEHINHFYQLVKSQSRRRKLENLQTLFKEVKMAGHMHVGITYVTMTHNDAWHFARLGRMLERADKTSRILDVKYFLLLPKTDHAESLQDNIVWGALLKSASAFEMYRKQFHRIDYQDVAGFLIFDRYFPRSVAHCLVKARVSLRKVSEGAELPSMATQALNRLYERIETGCIDQVTQIGMHQFIDGLQIDLNNIGSEIFQCFFAQKTFSP